MGPAPRLYEWRLVISASLATAVTAVSAPIRLSLFFPPPLPKEFLRLHVFCFVRSKKSPAIITTTALMSVLHPPAPPHAPAC